MICTLTMTRGAGLRCSADFSEAQERGPRSINVRTENGGRVGGVGGVKHGRRVAASKWKL